MDINLPGMNGIECIRQVKDKTPGTQFYDVQCSSFWQKLNWSEIGLIFSSLLWWRAGKPFWIFPCIDLIRQINHQLASWEKQEHQRKYFHHASSCCVIKIKKRYQPSKDRKSKVYYQHCRKPIPCLHWKFSFDDELKNKNRKKKIRKVSVVHDSHFRKDEMSI